MQNILFWVGYSKEPFDGNTTLGLGGTEVAVINIANRLKSYGLNVTVSGEVNNAIVNGIEWINIEGFKHKYSSKPNYFDKIIGVNYIHFIKYMELYNQTKAPFIFWAHNTEYYKWFEGDILTEEETERYLSKVDLLVTPSHWSLKYWVQHVYNNSEVSGVAIPNGINLDIFKNTNIKKDPNKFIWSSAVDRGLTELLDNWHKVKKQMPNATLDVYYPAYSNPHILEEDSWYNYGGILEKFDSLKKLGVTDMGSVSQSDLHYAMLKASYWMYLTQYEETFCITGLEMLAAEVLPICSDQAALKELIQDGIVISTTDYETMFNAAIKTLSILDSDLKNKAIKVAKDRSKLYTWNSSGMIWNSILKLVKKQTN